VTRARKVLASLWLVAAAAPAFAASDAGHGGGMFWQVVNVLLLLAVLIYFARKPVLTYLAERRDTIAKNLESSAQLLADAERRQADWNQKAANLDQEVAAIRDATRRAAEAERDRILADANASAERIRRAASAVIDRELQQARVKLRREAADLAVELAGKALREQVNDADRTRLLDEFIAHVEREAAR
jgi:F-type H+-transporting ATPase subunit b